MKFSNPFSKDKSQGRNGRELYSSFVLYVKEQKAGNNFDSIRSSRKDFEETLTEEERNSFLDELKKQVLKSKKKAKAIYQRQRNDFLDFLQSNNPKAQDSNNWNINNFLAYGVINAKVNGGSIVSREGNQVTTTTETVEEAMNFKLKFEMKHEDLKNTKLTNEQKEDFKIWLEEIKENENKTEKSVASKILALFTEETDNHKLNLTPSPQVRYNVKYVHQEDPKNSLKQENIPLLEFAYIVLGLKKSDYEFTPEDNEKIKNGKYYFISLRNLFNTSQIQEIIDATKNPALVTKVELPKQKETSSIKQSSPNSGNLKASLKTASENSVNAAGASSPKKPYPGSLEEKMNDTMNDQSADAKKTKKRVPKRISPKM